MAGAGKVRFGTGGLTETITFIGAFMINWGLKFLMQTPR